MLGSHLSRAILESPRGIGEHRRKALVAAARASAVHLGTPPDDRWLMALPLSHVAGNSILTRSLVARRAVVLFDPDERRTVRGRELPSRSKWSAYEGWELAGFPQVVVRRGIVAFEHGRVRGDAGGAPLRLEPPRSR